MDNLKVVYNEVRSEIKRQCRRHKSPIDNAPLFLSKLRIKIKKEQKIYLDKISRKDLLAVIIYDSLRDYTGSQVNISLNDIKMGLEDDLVSQWVKK